MDNEKDAEIIQFPEEKIVRNEPADPMLKNVRAKYIVGFLDEKLKASIYVGEDERLILVKLRIAGEIDIMSGDKKFTKKIDLDIPIDIDGLEDN